MQCVVLRVRLNDPLTGIFLDEFCDVARLVGDALMNCCISRVVQLLCYVEELILICFGGTVFFRESWPVVVLRKQ